MKLAIILNSSDPETAWNAFRLGVEALENKHHAKIFLLGKGVECETIQDRRFDVQRTINAFKKRNGKILACGTCLKLRQKNESKICPVSTMQDLLRLVEESDRILTFG
ncbi:MAG: DsrE family protein [Candidatus Diapherotrites archaeon]|nr:DsrE family protein [Candidatus Diapherotrites archaeon]